MNGGEIVKLVIGEEEHSLGFVRDFRRAAEKCDAASRACGGHGTLPATLLRRAGRAFRRAATEEEQLAKLLRD